MINAVMLVHNRPRLTQQAVDSFLAHTVSRYRLMIVDDYSSEETSDLLDEYSGDHVRIVHSRTTKLGPGLARNIGIKKSDQWGRGDLLYLCDNDCYFLPEWDRRLLAAWLEADRQGFKVLGGYCHPYQHTNDRWPVPDCEPPLEIHDKFAIGLLSWSMRWDTWDQFGVFDLSPRPNFGEDCAYSTKVREAGFRVGCVWPWVVVNCGLTGSNGVISPGQEHIFNQAIPSGVVIE